VGLHNTKASFSDINVRMRMSQLKINAIILKTVFIPNKR